MVRRSNPPDPSLKTVEGTQDLHRSTRLSPPSMRSDRCIGVFSPAESAHRKRMMRAGYVVYYADERECELVSRRIPSTSTALSANTQARKPRNTVTPTTSDQSEVAKS